MHTEIQRKFSIVQNYLNKKIIGQKNLVEKLLLALIAGGHVLIEGSPGLAKTRAIKMLAACITGSFKRIQMTYDLLPSDLVGVDIYQPQTGDFQFHPGPLFSDFVLVDEINRAPSKVQSALLEAMAEKQISVQQKTFQLSDIFTVMATQNPQSDEEGMYVLPKAQMDRFLFSVYVDYPSPEDEKKILNMTRSEKVKEKTSDSPPSLTESMILEARNAILNVHMVSALEDYMIRLVAATRNTQQDQDKKQGICQWLITGLSPRATQALDFAARSYAWLYGREFVSPHDIHSVIYSVFKHRLELTMEAEMAGYTPEKLIEILLNEVKVT